MPAPFIGIQSANGLWQPTGGRYFIRTSFRYPRLRSLSIVIQIPPSAHMCTNGVNFTLHFLAFLAFKRPIEGASGTSSGSPNG